LNKIPPKNIKKQVPVIALRGTVPFPDTFTRFEAVRNFTIEAVETAIREDNMVFLVTQKDVTDDLPTKDTLYRIGVYAKIKQIVRFPGEELRVLAEGVGIAKFSRLTVGQYLKANIEFLPYQNKCEDTLLEDSMRESLKKLYKTYFELLAQFPQENLFYVFNAPDLDHTCHHILSCSNFSYQTKQKYLEMKSVEKKANALLAQLAGDIEVLKMQKKLETQVKQNIDDGQKKYYLREQLKAISQELGEDAQKENKDYKEYAEKINHIKASGETKEKLLKELNKLVQMPQLSTESGLIKNYLDTVLSLPWNTLTKEKYDLTRAEEILNAEHYGLIKLKERILEYLAVKKLAPKTPSPILCLVGPPGVGKTSIVKSIAHAANRKYAHVSLGGVRDEAEIRGHRKTYIGAMPGRIMSALITAKSKNPVMLLDEIDKLSSDYKGDPTSAMLEALDPEQNYAFTDHYIEVPFDLSDVIFITTANDRSAIPTPLFDRMEIVEFDGYTKDEKYHIATEHLIPKLMDKHGLTPQKLSIEKDALMDVINSYTYEAGVRTLERTLAKVIRKSIKKMIDEDENTINIERDDVLKFLGKPIYEFDPINEKDEVGIVRGLAWTQGGGDTLSIEVNIMDGSGDIELTGQLGDVMKESAKTAISYVRSKTDTLKIQPDFYKTKDLHIHIPEGAVPKDGPSAGIAMATAVISALTGFRVKRNVAMTGEITLRGHVLPIGGLKEKSMAAHRAGVKTILFPKKNEKDLDDISEEVKKDIHFIPVENMNEVLLHALTLKEKPSKEKSGKSILPVAQMMQE